MLVPRIPTPSRQLLDSITTTTETCDCKNIKYETVYFTFMFMTWYKTVKICRDCNTVTVSRLKKL